MEDDGSVDTTATHLSAACLAWTDPSSKICGVVVCFSGVFYMAGVVVFVGLNSAAWASAVYFFSHNFSDNKCLFPIKQILQN